MLLRNLAFKVLNIYSTIWMRSRAKVVLRGLGNVPSGRKPEKRVYLLLNHPTSYDIVALMHLSKEPFVVMMDKGAFTFPIIRHILSGAGFVPLDKGDSKPAFDSCLEAVRDRRPLLISLHEGDSTIGEKGRPRTGGLRLAHLAGAALYPIFLKVEEERIRRLRFTGVNGKEYPYTTFRNTLYFVEFLPPVDLSRLPEGASYEDYRAMAEEMDALGEAANLRYATFLTENARRLAPLRRRGGARLRLAF
jgi:1-acyl-sn-glycerol-3-phosphate acyltransferase